MISPTLISGSIPLLVVSTSTTSTTLAATQAPLPVIASPTDVLAQAAAFVQHLPGGQGLFTVLMFVVVLSILVFVHEWGHYAAARSVGIRVTAFSIGFGRRLLSWVDSHGTRWQLAWLPVGGYVQLHGQEDGKPYGEVQDADSFSAKPVWARMWVIIAGPLANLVFAFVLMCAVMLTGDHKLKAEVGQVVSDMPAAGILQTGDVVTQADGVKVVEWDDLQNYVQDHAGQPVQLTVQRPGSVQPMQLTLTPKATVTKDLLGETHTVGRVGIAPSYATFVVKHPPLDAFKEAAAKTWQLFSLTLKSLGKLLIGAISADNLTGPLGIADMAGQTAANGFFAVAMFMTVISINLGIVNLIPLPVLDGGHLVFLAYEAVMRKPLSARFQWVALQAGMVLIVLLALFATLNDVKRFGWLKHLPFHRQHADAAAGGTASDTKATATVSK